LADREGRRRAAASAPDESASKPPPPLLLTSPLPSARGRPYCVRFLPRGRCRPAARAEQGPEPKAEDPERGCGRRRKIRSRMPSSFLYIHIPSSPHHTLPSTPHAAASTSACASSPRSKDQGRRRRASGRRRPRPSPSWREATAPADARRLHGAVGSDLFLCVGFPLPCCIS
jgi:hypothetical protein